MKHGMWGMVGLVLALFIASSAAQAVTPSVSIDDGSLYFVGNACPGGTITVFMTLTNNDSTNANEGRVYASLARKSTHPSCGIEIQTAEADKWWLIHAGGAGAPSTTFPNDGGYISNSSGVWGTKALSFVVTIPAAAVAGETYTLNVSSSQYYFDPTTAGMANDRQCLDVPLTCAISPPSCSVSQHLEGTWSNAGGDPLVFWVDYDFINTNSITLSDVIPTCFYVVGVGSPPGGSGSFSGQNVTFNIGNANAANDYRRKGTVYIAVVPSGSCAAGSSQSNLISATSSGCTANGNTLMFSEGGPAVSLSKQQYDGAYNALANGADVASGSTVHYVLQYSVSGSGMPCFDPFDQYSVAIASPPALPGGIDLANSWGGTWKLAPGYGAVSGETWEVVGVGGDHYLRYSPNTGTGSNYDSLLFNCPTSQPNGEDSCLSMVIADVQHAQPSDQNADAGIWLRHDSVDPGMGYMLLLSGDTNPGPGNGHLIVWRSNGTAGAGCCSWPADSNNAIAYPALDGVWYTVKGVEITPGHILAKFWKRGDPEPAAWMIDWTDPSPLPGCNTVNGAVGDGHVWRPGVGGLSAINLYDNFRVFGSSGVSGFKLWDTVPAGIDYVSASSTPNGSVPAGNGVSEGLARWDFTGNNFGARGGLLYGGSGSFTWTGTVDGTEAGNISNTASADATGLSTQLSNAVTLNVVVVTATVTPTLGPTGTGTHTPTLTLTPTVTPTFSNTPTADLTPGCVNRLNTRNHYSYAPYYAVFGRVPNNATDTTGLDGLGETDVVRLNSGQNGIWSLDWMTNIGYPMVSEIKLRVVWRALTPGSTLKFNWMTWYGSVTPAMASDLVLSSASVGIFQTDVTLLPIPNGGVSPAYYFLEAPVGSDVEIDYVALELRTAACYTVTALPTHTTTPTVCPACSFTVSPTITTTRTVTPTLTLTRTVTPTPSASFTTTPTATLAQADTATFTPTPASCVASAFSDGRMCIALYAPVCGCNGLTYPSDCDAESWGIMSYTSGVCGGTPTVTPTPTLSTGGPDVEPYNFFVVQTGEGLCAGKAFGVHVEICNTNIFSIQPGRFYVMLEDVANLGAADCTLENGGSPDSWLVVGDTGIQDPPIHNFTWGASPAAGGYNAGLTAASQCKTFDFGGILPADLVPGRAYRFLLKVVPNYAGQAGTCDVLTYNFTPSCAYTNTATPSLTPTLTLAITSTNSPTVTATPSPAILATASITRTPGPALQVDKVLLSGDGSAGSTASWRITVLNLGPGGLMPGSGLTDDLPSAASYLSSIPSATVAGNRVTWTLGGLAQGASTSVTLSANVLTTDALCNQARAAGIYTNQPVAYSNMVCVPAITVSATSTSTPRPTLTATTTFTPTRTLTTSPTATITPTMSYSSSPTATPSSTSGAPFTASPTALATWTSTPTPIPTLAIIPVVPGPGGRIYPSPARGPVVNLALNLPSPGTVRLIVLDSRMRVVINATYTVPAGPTSVPVDISKLRRGIYFYRVLITLDNGTILRPGSGRFTVVR